MPQVFKPRPYQTVACNYLWENRSAALYLDPGMGKSACATLTIQKSLHHFDTLRWLIVAPKRVCETTWYTEFTKWLHVQDLTVCHLVNRGMRERECAARTAVADGTNVTVINVENLRWLIKLWGRDWPYDGVVLDESSKFKDPGTKRFKELKRVTPYIDRLIELTGSPCAQGLLGLWAQVYLLDNGEALGRTMSAYKTKFFESDYMGYSWTPREGAEESILNAIRGFCMTMRALDHVEGVTEPNHNDLVVKLDPENLTRYADMERHYLLELGDEVITAQSGGVLVGKLQQIASGILYDPIDPLDPAKKRGYTILHEAKLDALEDFLDEMSGTPFIVAYTFRAERELLKKRFGKKVELFDGTPGQLERWRRKQIPMLALHPDSGGHGVDGLQHASCTVVWLGPPWSREKYDQLNGRVTGTRQLGTEFEGRAGQVHRIIVEGTVDQLIAAQLEYLGETQDRVLASLRRYATSLQRGEA